MKREKEKKRRKLKKKGLWVLILYEVIDEKFTIHKSHISSIYIPNMFFLLCYFTKLFFTALKNPKKTSISALLRLWWEVDPTETETKEKTVHDVSR